MVSGKRTPREVEERVVELARQGKTARETSDASGVPIDTVRKIVRRTPGVSLGAPSRLQRHTGGRGSGSRLPVGLRAEPTQ